VTVGACSGLSGWRVSLPGRGQDCPAACRLAGSMARAWPASVRRECTGPLPCRAGGFSCGRWAVGYGRLGCGIVGSLPVMLMWLGSSKRIIAAYASLLIRQFVRCSPCGIPSGQLRRSSFQLRGVRSRQWVTSLRSWATSNPSHWPARGPCSAFLSGPGPSRARGRLRPSSSGLSRVLRTVALTGVEPCTVVWALSPAGARTPLVLAGPGGPSMRPE
jgi:hypothetical protein